MRVHNVVLAGLGLISVLGIPNASLAQQRSDAAVALSVAAKSTPVAALMAPAGVPNGNVRESDGIAPPGTVDDTQAVTDRIATDMPHRLPAPTAP